jgi:superfamily II DNA or RNA helicase
MLPAFGLHLTPGKMRLWLSLPGGTAVNVTPRKELRPYQARLIADVCRSNGHALVEQPTGSGKTLQVVTLVAMQLGRRFTHAVIAAPQQQIEDGFVHLDYRLVGFPACQGVAAPDIEVPEGLIWGARRSELGSVRRVIAYLRQPGPLDHALACTHAALNRLAPERLPEDLSGKALFIDEAHHASADGLSEIVTLWQDRGGQLYFFTATPYRGDGRPVALDGMRLYRRSLAEHMAEGFAPRHLESEIVALGRPGDAITAGQFTGEDAPPPDYFDGLVMAICRKWVDDGKPKAIVRVPPMRGGSEGLVNRLLHALAAEGARTLDATGTAAEDKRRFLRALTAEKDRTHAPSRYDVMVGIQRVLEGTDWPVCSAVYCVGMPGSLNTVVQFLGRAMRLKGQDYPEQHRDRARLVFFVPCGAGAALADLSIDHSRHALLTCCFLADHEVGQEWIVLREVRRGIEEALGSPEQNSAAAEAEIDAAQPLDPEVRAEVELVLADAREHILGQGREPTLGDVVQQAMQVRKDLPESAIRQVAVEVLAGQGSADGASACDAIRREVARRLRIQPEIKQAMEEAFAAVLDEFRDATLQKSAVLESVGRQVHGVTGGQMQEFARRLRDAAPRPLTEEQILAWADAHHARTGEWPVVACGSVTDVPGETWANIDASLRVGNRGLPGGSSLPQLLERCRGVRNHLALPPLTIEQVLSWADAHHERTGQWPSRESGAIEGTQGEVWISINTALRMGQRGLLGSSSLAQLLSEKRDVRNRGDLPVLTIDQILSWADQHYERTGHWPAAKSGSIKDAPGETWANVNQALATGRRGLPGGSSLAKQLSQHRGRRNQKDQPPLTVQEILAWADAHHEATGKWPKKNSGTVQGAGGETWSGINDFLIRGGRNLPGGSSLPRLLAEQRGVRNKQDLPRLTVDRILEWADAHHQRTGKWPTRNSGQIVDAPEETWKVVQMALFQGLRGLPGGSSLARLLAEKRGVRNMQALPPFTLDQVLAWADAHHSRTGKWPTERSGFVVEAPGDTWKAIDRALQAGVRGLPGGSSLARLIREQRRASVS